MRADAFFDTTVIVYASVDDPLRTPVAQELLASGGVISVQVLNEYAAVMRRKHRSSWQRIQEGLALARKLCPDCIVLTEDIHDAAVELAERYNFHIYDALIVAAALDAGCTTLFTEDLQDGQRVRGLTVRNPFRKRN